MKAQFTTASGAKGSSSRTLDLVRTRLATQERAFYFPFGSGDLRPGEYVAATAVHKGNGLRGVQTFAHDIGLRGVNDGKWSALIDEKKGDKINDNYCIWGMPVRAMADGEVASFAIEVETNDILGKAPETTAHNTGNHFWIKHDDGLFSVYAHMQKGTLPVELLHKGARVRAGQVLGLAGNSCRSTNPHVHIQVQKDVPGRDGKASLHALALRNARCIDQESFKPPKKTDPWFVMTGQGVPRADAAIWPGTTTPGCPVPAVGIARGGDWTNTFWLSGTRAEFEASVQSLFDKQKQRTIWATTYLENGQRRFAGIARSGEWASTMWISDTRSAFEKTAQDLFDKKGLRLTHVHTWA